MENAYNIPEILAITIVVFGYAVQFGLMVFDQKALAILAAIVMIAVVAAVLGLTPT